MLAVLLSSLALGRAARVQEFGEVGNEVSEAIEKHVETVQGVTYDELNDRTCTSTAWTFCKSPASWWGWAGDTGNLCCLQGHYSCKELGITGNCRGVWDGEHCCTKVATTTTTTTTTTTPYIKPSAYRCSAWQAQHIPRGTDNGRTFRCLGGQCIPGRDRCNGVQNCGDGSDEIGCTTPDQSYVSSAVQCDAVDSRIPRGTDNGKTFRCRGGQCIPMRGRCNGVTNCRDGSDEMDCTATATTTTSTTTTTTTTRHDGPGAIKVMDGSTCLSVSGNTISASNCNGRSSQMWEWTHGAAFGSLKNVETGKCLRHYKCVKGAAHLSLDKCNAHDENQQFQPAVVQRVNGWIMAKACTSMCLDVDMKSNDKKVGLWHCKNGWGKNQRMWLDFV